MINSWKIEQTIYLRGFLDLHETHPAVAGNSETFMVTESGNFNADESRSLQDEQLLLIVCDSIGNKEVILHTSMSR